MLVYGDGIWLWRGEGGLISPSPLSSSPNLQLLLLLPGRSPPNSTCHDTCNFPICGRKKCLGMFFLGDGLTAGNCTSLSHAEFFLEQHPHPIFPSAASQERGGREQRGQFHTGARVVFFSPFDPIFLWEIELRDAAMKRFCFGTTFKDSFHGFGPGKMLS